MAAPRASRNEQSSGLQVPSLVSAVFVTTNTVFKALDATGHASAPNATAARIKRLALVTIARRLVQKDVQVHERSLTADGANDR
jgi:hypothetical protein